jgi:hypothetical protein
MNYTIRTTQREERGLIYVYRRINGTDVPLLINTQRSYREWLGCFSAL